MQINTDVWWYVIPAAFHDRLERRAYNDLCSLVRGLTWGWIKTIGFLLYIVATFLLVVGVGLGSFWYAALGLFDSPLAGMRVLIISGAFNSVVLCTAALLAVDYFDLLAGYKIWLNKRYSKSYIKSTNTQPSIVRSWLKGLKEKTCIIVELD